MVRATHSEINTVYVAFIIIYFATVEDVYCASTNAGDLNSQLKGQKAFPSGRGEIKLETVRASKPSTLDPNKKSVSFNLGDPGSLANGGLHGIGSTLIATGGAASNLGRKSSSFGQNAKKYGEQQIADGKKAKSASGWGAIFSDGGKNGDTQKIGTSSMKGMLAGEAKHRIGTEAEYAGRKIDGIGTVIDGAGRLLSSAGHGINSFGDRVSGKSRK